MHDTTCRFDDASLLTDDGPPAMIDTTESISIVVEEEEEEKEKEGEEEKKKEKKEEKEEDEEEEENKEEDSLEGVGKMIQDLAHRDNVKVDAALVALNLDVCKGKENCDAVIVWGGCAALVHLLKDRLKKAMKKDPACDQITKLNELAELTNLYKTFAAITNLTYKSEMGKVGIATVGGVEAAVKVMQTFPKCRPLQERACRALRNLASCSIGKAKAIGSGGIEVVLAAVKNHLGSASLCETVCGTLCNFANGSEENIGLLISLGGAAAVAKVRTKWPDNNDVQASVRKLANLIAAEMKTWADER
jgi:hypothetical protein